MAWAEQLQTVGVLPALGCLLGAYALGCFTTGYYFVRARTGRDIRALHSGSSGARNVSRVLGKTGFVVTMLGDCAKGALAVWVARHFTGSNLLAAAAMLAVVVGHIWPVTLHGHGGKGVITSLGALGIYDFHLALAFAACFLPGLVLLRKMTLPGLAAYLCLPVVGFWLHRDPVEATMLLALAAMVIFAHRQNILDEFPALAARRALTVKPQHTKP
jgi:glycerol-3-phosphate acyltransferase PlsY